MIALSKFVVLYLIPSLDSNSFRNVSIVVWGEAVLSQMSYLRVIVIHP